MAKKKIFFHGSINHLLPEPVEVDADSPIEAMSALVEMHPELKQVVSFDERPIVQIVGFVTELQLRSPTDAAEIHVIPAMLGAGGGRSGGFLRIVIGAVVIAAAIIATGGTGAFASWSAFSAAWSATSASFIGSLALSLGTSLILGGLLSIISPVPKRDGGIQNQADPEASKYLGAQRNTVKIGTRIPIAYGTCKVYGHYLSFDSQATDVAI